MATASARPLGYGSGGSVRRLEQPLVTIVTPILNCAPYVEACLDSVLAQSYSVVEHVLADGGSSDDTVDILARYAARYHGRIRYTSQKDSHSGCGEAWNRALRMGRGDIFGWLGGDDMLTPQAIEHVVRFMQTNSEAYFVHGACHYVDQEGKHMYTKWPRQFTLKQLINDRNYVCFPTAFYRREVVQAVGAADAYGNDYEYVIRVAKLFPIYQIQEPLAMFRLRPESETSRMVYDEHVRRLDYNVARQHGARLLSRNSCRYYAFWVAKRFRLLHAYYSLVSPLRRRLTHGGGAFGARQT